LNVGHHNSALMAELEALPVRGFEVFRTAGILL
jgi:hypothetical protein